MMRELRVKPHLIMRWVLAGPGAVVFAVAVLAGMPTYLPPGEAGVNHLMLPLIFFPLFWGMAIFYALLEENMVRTAIIMSVLTLGHVIAAYASGGWS
ncbi:MAG: hypothetical protein AAGC95_00255 [Pseudomonadota bacterium]